MSTPTMVSMVEYQGKIFDGTPIEQQQITMPVVGTKEQVYNGKAQRTAGGLRKADIMRVKGRYVSKRQRAQHL
jgi:hypothetical protein